MDRTNTTSPESSNSVFTRSEMCRHGMASQETTLTPQASKSMSRLKMKTSCTQAAMHGKAAAAMV